MTTTTIELNLDAALDAIITAALHTIALDPALDAAINSRDDADDFLALMMLTAHRTTHLALNSIIDCAYALLDATDIDAEMLTMRIERISDRDL